VRGYRSTVAVAQPPFARNRRFAGRADLRRPD
jgi:hypothetical protein